MKTSLFAIITTIVLCITSCQTSEKYGKVDQKEIDEVTALLTEYTINWANAIKNKNGTEVENYFAGDIIYQTATGNLLSKNELIVDIEDFPYDVESFNLEDIKVKLFSNGLAVVTGGARNVWMDENGEQQIYESRFTNVWRKTASDWICIIGHGSPLQKGNVMDDLESIREIPVKAAMAINSNDFEAWLDLFDENAMVMFREQETISGKLQMAEKLAKFWTEAAESDYSIQHTEARIAGDYAYGIGTVTGTEKDLATGKIVDVNSRETIIFKRQDNGEWKVFRLMVNQNE
jgi:ketosteroid isomerase-like protein